MQGRDQKTILNFWSLIFHTSDHTQYQDSR